MLGDTLNKALHPDLPIYKGTATINISLEEEIEEDFEVSDLNKYVDEISKRWPTTSSVVLSFTIDL